MKTVFHTYKKLILFIGMIIAVLVCNHIFGWSAMLSGTGSMNLLRQMAEENLVNAIFLYTVITVVGCVALTLCCSGRTAFRTGIGNNLLFYCYHDRSHGSVSGRPLLPEG